MADSGKAKLASLATSCDFHFTLTFCHSRFPHTIPVTPIPFTQSLSHSFPSHILLSHQLPSHTLLSHSFPSHTLLSQQLPSHPPVTPTPFTPSCHTHSSYTLLSYSFPHTIPVTRPSWPFLITFPPLMGSPIRVPTWPLPIASSHSTQPRSPPVSFSHFPPHLDLNRLNQHQLSHRKDLFQDASHHSSPLPDSSRKTHRQSSHSGVDSKPFLLD